MAKRKKASDPVKASVWTLSPPPQIPGRETSDLVSVGLFRLDARAVDRIVAAVGIPRGPKNVNFSELGSDIFRANALRVMRGEMEDSSRRKARNSHLRKIGLQTKALIDLLSDGHGEWVRRGLTSIFPREHGDAELEKLREEAFRTIGIAPEPPGSRPTLRAFLDGLGFLEEAVSQLVSDQSQVAPLSPLDVFLGDHLLEVYQRHFERRATISRNQYAERPTAEGRYIRFATAVMTELAITNNGLPYRPETIARARSNVRSGRSRRKKIA